MSAIVESTKGRLSVSCMFGLVLCYLGRSSASGEELLKWTQSATYFADEANCNVDGSSDAIGADWGGRHWRIAAPKSIDTSESWERKFGTGLHLRPSKTLRDGIVNLGGVVGDQEVVGAKDDQGDTNETRLRLVLVNHNDVGQDFSGPWRFVRVVVRLCEKRNGVWRSVRYETSRGVVGKKEFWKTQSKAVREQDYAFDFDRAVSSALNWAQATAGTPWVDGAIVVDKKALLWNPRRNTEDDLNAR